MLCLDYKHIQGDHTRFLKHTQGGSRIIHLVYVDDVVITGYHLSERQFLKKILSAELEMKDLGVLKCFFGITVTHSNKCFLYLGENM